MKSTTKLKSKVKDLYIFDFDGVLVDSVEIKAKAFNELYSPYGSEIAEKIVFHHIQNGGMSRYDKFKYYHKEFLNLPIKPDTINFLSNKFSSIVIEKILKCDEIEGALDCLSFCLRHGITCAVNSATPQDELNYIILEKGWKKYFKYIYGSPNSKSDNLKKIINNTKIEKNKVIFFGDSLSDFKAADENEIDFVGINYFSRKEEIFPCFDNFIDFLT